VVQLSWQTTLPGWGGDRALSYERLRRVRLSSTTWADYCPAWLSDADELMAELISTASWRQRERPMYDAMVTEPRLVTGWSGADMPAPVMTLRTSLSNQYGVHFDSCHVNLYRSGADSVAWHGDTVRKVLRDPLVGIVSLGERRRFRLRPRGGGGPTTTFQLGGGDLLVMGGASQHEWEHSVPKVAAAGPRMSVTFRHSQPIPPSDGN
jgi:alkylated DNA repair dioxygenase AlkB